MKIKYILQIIFTLVVSVGFTIFKFRNNSILTDWPEYLGGKDRNHFTKLDQINKSNLQNLTVAWEYDCGTEGQMQTSPIMVDGMLFGVTANVQAFALDAATGKEIWKFGDSLKAWHSTSRGVAYWADGEDKRILYTVGSFLYALNAKTGVPIKEFGKQGKVDLHLGLPEIAASKFVISNTPGTIFNDLIVMPLRLSEGPDAAPGDIRAFNVRTGTLAWSFHTIPHPGEYGYKTFPKEAYKNTEIGGANNWAGMALDEARGILYVPTGSAAYDFYGGNRKGINLFSNCLLALDAATGNRIWHYQFTHHDIWDRDLPAPPNLLTINHKGKKVDVVAQVTKQGFVFVFDRLTGKSIYKIDEVPVKSSELPEEKAWKTQPKPRLPLPFARQSEELTEADISPFAENREELLKIFRTLKKGFYDPPSKTGTLLLPGYDGAAEWGGAGVNQHGVMFVNSNEMPWIMTIKDNPRQEKLNAMTLGQKTYQQFCLSCHGAERKGNPQSNYPSLVNIAQKKKRDEVQNLITNGKGMMPGYPGISSANKQALIDFLYGTEKQEVGSHGGSDYPYVPYGTTGYNKFLDNKGLPAIAPPWGTLSAIDLNSGITKWKIPFGFEPKLSEKNTGCENYGGPIVTSNGLLMIAATKDEMFRIFDQETGALLWEYHLPAAAFATPITYAVNGKQYVVLACGGTKLGTKPGRKYLAFTL